MSAHASTLPTPDLAATARLFDSEIPSNPSESKNPSIIKDTSKVSRGSNQESYKAFSLPHPIASKSALSRPVDLSKVNMKLLKEQFVLVSKGLQPNGKSLRKAVEIKNLPSRYPKVNRTLEKRIQLLQTSRAHNAVAATPAPKEPRKRWVSLPKRNESHDERLELEKLKLQSLEARSRLPSKIKTNWNTELRLKMLQNEPIITSRFKKAFLHYGKSPFELMGKRHRVEDTMMPHLSPYQTNQRSNVTSFRVQNTLKYAHRPNFTSIVRRPQAGEPNMKTPSSLNSVRYLDIKPRCMKITAT